MSSVTEISTLALGKQGEMLFGAPDWQFAYSFARVLLLRWGLKTETWSGGCGSVAATGTD
jgi:hypothetical protein